jgi:hypothetical protein
VTAVLLFIFATPVEHFFQTTFGTKGNPSDVPASKISTKVNIRYKYINRDSNHAVNYASNTPTMSSKVFFVNHVEKRNCLNCQPR